MLKTYAKVFGLFFIVIGILGFIPGITYKAHIIGKAHLFGVFQVNGVLNCVHLVTGIVGYLVSRVSLRASQLFFQVFGIVYVAVGLIGFGYGSRDIFGIMANNLADTWLHLVAGLVSLYWGFLYKNK
jgi:hypothetical protein